MKYIFKLHQISLFSARTPAVGAYSGPSVLRNAPLPRQIPGYAYVFVCRAGHSTHANPIYNPTPQNMRIVIVDVHVQLTLLLQVGLRVITCAKHLGYVFTRVCLSVCRKRGKYA